MEPVTHFLTGACLARAGFNRKTAYATLAMTLAAELPDLDTSVGSLRGPVAGFEHHRGMDAYAVGLPVEAAVVLAGCGCGTAGSVRRDASKAPAARRELAGALGHAVWLCLRRAAEPLLLDWTNNYGVRPFFPFNPRWYAGSFVFIFEPVMFVLLLVGLVAPWLFGLVGARLGARREPFRGRGWAIVCACGGRAAVVLARLRMGHGRCGWPWVGIMAVSR